MYNSTEKVRGVSATMDTKIFSPETAGKGNFVAVGEARGTPGDLAGGRVPGGYDEKTRCC